ncbi:PAS domain S-box-containing protein [Sphingomonas xinjiangensis]|uniref:histidine kinase n=2 Tax=Sphingomonas xinjiangensis TaxID=643568 RepID=A0A840YRA2_9SPHN|nr:PAS domain S-box-containing protein [Sphingomonas xinjiangensis]
MDDRQRCVFMNRAAEQLTGYSLTEITCSDRPLHEIIHHTYPDGRHFPLHECAIDRAFPEHNHTKGEEVFVHKNGSFYPVAFTASPIRDDASDIVGTIVEVRDISEEKLAEERQRLLINELNHRVKNTLATVQAIAWQTFKGSDARKFDGFNDRLLALSKAHNLLTDSAWEGASILDIVSSVLEPFDLNRVDLHGADGSIPPKAAVSITLVLHELATNAAKYGAFSCEGGRLKLIWFFAETADGRKLAFAWQEEGGPPVAAPAHKGFGTRLIERQLELEYGGKSKLRYDPSGVHCELCIPLPTKRRHSADMHVENAS